MKPGIKDVAKVAGVSPTTVSRVLNNRGYISEETRKKVYDAMEEINYYPNEIARALLNNRTYFVGVIVPTVTSPFHGEVVEQIEYYLSQKNYKMLLCNSKNQMDTEKAYIDMLRRNQVDGMIVGTHNAASICSSSNTLASNTSDSIFVNPTRSMLSSIRSVLYSVRSLDNTRPLPFS